MKTTLILLLFSQSLLLGSPTGVKIRGVDDFAWAGIEGTTIECSVFEGLVMFDVNFRRPERRSHSDLKLTSILCIRSSDEEESTYEFTSRTELADQPNNRIRFGIPEQKLHIAIFWIEHHHPEKSYGTTYIFDLKAIAANLLHMPSKQP